MLTSLHTHIRSRLRPLLCTLALTLGTIAVTASDAHAAFQVEETTIAKIQEAILAKQLTST